MEELLEWMDYIGNIYQKRKIKHPLKDILVIALIVTLTNVNDWVEMEMFVEAHQEYL